MKISIQTTVDADVQKVWNYYSLPEHITNWNFASDDWHCPHAENDLQPGGRYKARMEAKDGSFGFDFEATYDEVIKHKKIVYTLDDGRKVVTDFENQDGKTKVITVFEAESENSIEMQKEGWQAILNNFKKYTEAS
ncbi:SRPBCC family protein [Gracilimonas sp. BCB1]|uniref:SRPBCC family protein n=1 Tax=Gracilimonas sp. BCB1 TaxID=3152362 RepID=UPI0032D92418